MNRSLPNFCPQVASSLQMPASLWTAISANLGYQHWAMDRVVEGWVSASFVIGHIHMEWYKYIPLTGYI